MKEKATYKRFDFLAGLAILGCIGMLIFECFFIFEVYDRVPLQLKAPAPAKPVPEVEAPSVSSAPAMEKTVIPVTNTPPVTNVAPVSQELVEPAEIKKVSPVIPVG